MTKILYLPTGRYLKFLSNFPTYAEEAKYTEIVELSANFNNICHSSMYEFISYLTKPNTPNAGVSWAPWFIQLNELMPPIIKEDLEIIND